MKSNRYRAVGIAIFLTFTSTSLATVRADLSGDGVAIFPSYALPGDRDMPLMTVGNPGNAPDTTGLGAVDYTYNIGKFEVTAAQYAVFLSAVAATDTYGLYDGGYENVITQSGGSGDFRYSVSPGMGDLPVGFVDWGDAARFCNWLTNGMPTGPQDSTTTEDGSYLMSEGVFAINRRADARYVLPTEDEWYKAAYHANDGITGNYFEYPTGTDVAPTPGVVWGPIPDPDPGNYANFDGGVDARLTFVGEFENSASPYGAFDMGGNVREWVDIVLYGPYGTYRSKRGGVFGGELGQLHASYRGYDNPALFERGTGFRIVELLPVPEPATMSLLVLGGIALLKRRNK